MLRTEFCGKITKQYLGKKVVVSGWVHRRRDHGGLIFIDLRDREGLVQVVFNPEKSPEPHQVAREVRPEYVLKVEGSVLERPQGTENPDLPTGLIEIHAERVEILNSSKPPPFSIEEDRDVAEELRLKYRYLDLRRPSVQKKLIFRHTLARETRNWLDRRKFLEIETPFLTRSTPEGARDFLVPSRLNPGTFYALPQSPQLFKQILMISGFDRYYQIVRCFRDEDLRADRQPEFTQIDIEMSFVEREDVLKLMEEMLYEVIGTVTGLPIQTPFSRLTYAEAMSRYGTDKPDLRFGMELADLSQIAKEVAFNVFREAVAGRGVVKGINAKGLSLSRSELDAMTERAKGFGAKGLAWMKVTENSVESPIAKFFTEGQIREILKGLGGEKGDLLLFAADAAATAQNVLGQLRLEIARRQNLMAADKLDFAWVTDFPLLEFDPEEKRYVAMHHPFTAPMDEDLSLLDSDPLAVRAKAYDIVLNGSEIGGGSIRNHRREIQSKFFKLLSLPAEEAEAKFGFLLTALEYGAPPHGGIAFGFDRLVAIMSGAESIREVIAFPKTQKGICLMTEAPASVDPKQLKELKIRPESRERIGSE